MKDENRASNALPDVATDRSEIMWRSGVSKVNGCQMLGVPLEIGVAERGTQPREGKVQRSHVRQVQRRQQRITIIEIEARVETIERTLDVSNLSKLMSAVVTESLSPSNIYRSRPRTARQEGHA